MPARTSKPRTGTPPRPGPDRTGEQTKRNVEVISRIEAKLRGERTPVDKAIDAVTAFCGSYSFIWIHLIWYGGWILLNTLLPKAQRFDEFPFTFLTLVVSLEAIFLSTFILITQNRQARIAELRSHLDLQINLLDEQETTKILRMLEQIENKLGIQEKDPEIKKLEREVEPATLVEQIEHVIEGMQEHGLRDSTHHGGKPAKRGNRTIRK